MVETLNSILRICAYWSAQAVTPGPWAEEEAQAKEGSAGLQATWHTSGKEGSSRTCATMRFVSTCHALMPLPTVPTSLHANGKPNSQWELLLEQQTRRNCSTRGI